MASKSKFKFTGTAFRNGIPEYNVKHTMSAYSIDQAIFLVCKYNRYSHMRDVSYEVVQEPEQLSMFDMEGVC